ncbi:tetratricopeptide repeat protein, partial [bacterium]|nr:tetratricopeptide repeat protein [bacterium]
AATGGPSDPELAVTMTNLAIALRRLDRPAEAESLYQESLAQQLEIFGEEHLSVVETLNSLGALQTNYGDPVESEETLRRSLRLCRAMFPDGHRQTAVALNNLGYLLQAEGRVPEAETLYRESLEMRKRVLGPDHPDVGTALNNLGRAVRDQGRYEDAVALFRESIALRKRTLGDRHIQVATASSNLAKLLETMARDATGAPRAVRLKEAEDLARESLSIRRGAFDGDHSRVVTGLAVLARVVAARGRPAAAESLYVESIDMVRRLGAGDREAICPLLEGRANLLMDRGAHDLAIPLLAESAAVRERNHPPGHRRIARVQGALGECYAVAGRYAEAESLLVASHAAFSSADRSPGADLVKARARLVDLYERMGTSGKAAPYRPEPPGPDGRD